MFGGRSMRTQQTDFSHGSVYRNILEVAVPMTVAQCLNLLYNIVDRIYIGRIPGSGSLALSGVGLCFPIITMITAFTYLFGNGGAPLCAIQRGKGDRKEAEAIMGNTFVLLVACGLVLMLIGLCFYEPILYLFGASENTLPYAEEYITIYLLGTVFVMISVGMNPFISGQGFGRTSMMTVLIGALLNIILDPVFIFLLDLGVRGAAIATILSQGVSALWVLAFLRGKRAELHLKREAFRLKAKRVREIVSLGVSGFVMAFTNSLVQIVCNATLQQYGGDLYVGIMTILNSVREIFTMPLQGLTNGASPVMSYNYGERAYKRVRQAIIFVSVGAVIYTMTAWGLVRFFPDAFIRIFDGSGTMLEKGREAMHIYFFGFCFMALQFAGQSVFVALGKAGRATFFSLFRKVIIVVPLTILLPRLFGLGVYGVFWAEPISNLLGGLASYLTMLATVLPELGFGKGAKGKGKTEDSIPEI